MDLERGRVIAATVTTATPLTVTLDGSTTAAPARVMGRADSWAPAVGTRVIVEAVGRALYVLGLA